ncbi:MAG: GTP-binding protein [Selenomonadaceae bacterium]|nr:GTP-binding protein [Selenomonadaceae bacterium]MBR1730793.1 GTP-binding protein [Selenomonadaceae bacterium]
MVSELKIVFVGHVDHGKSTIIGRLLYETHSLPQGIINKVQRIADETGKNFEYAYLLDAFAEERQQGITIDMTQIQFSTEKRDYLIIDAPGHKEFLKNMISGAANANAAFLVIDAAAGVQEQSRRHAYLLSLLGISKIYVIVNKMDLVNYSEKRFNEVVNEMKKFLESLNVKPKEFIPISGFIGDNVTIKSEKLSWYNGETLIKTLDLIENDENIKNQSLRLPIQDVYKFDDRRIIAGRIESGNLKIGDKIKIYPEGRETKIIEIAYWLEKDKKNKAIAGESVGIIVEDEFFNKRGEIITKIDDKSPNISNRLRASVFWLGKNPLTIGKKYKLKLATSEIEAEVEKILRVVDASSLESNNSAQKLKINDIGEIIFKLKKKLAFDNFGEYQATGRFVLVEGYDVSGGGIILSNELSIINGTTFQNENLIVNAEIFDEFYYDVEKRQITQVSETENKNYKIGDKIPTSGFSFDYPADFDIIILNESAAISIREEKITKIIKLDEYEYKKIPLINGRGFGIKVNNEEQFNEFISEYKAVTNANELAKFSNKYFFLNQYRELKFYFDYVI